MSLIVCPECGHDVSASAVACPSCGRPLSAPAVERKVVVMPPPVVHRESGFPNWAFIPIGLIALSLIVVAFMVFREPDDRGNLNVNVNMAGRRTPEPVRDSRTSTVPASGNPAVAVPPSQTTTVPGSATDVPVAPLPDKGTVVINAKITTASGQPQAARNAKFYLLEKDVETILSEARVEPIEGNSMMGSVGLAAVYPDRYGDFQRSAMRAIAAASKYSGTTAGSGAASLPGIAPDEYYLFAVVRVNNGFALWNSPVSVVPGQNILNLSPQPITEIPASQ